MFWQSGGTTVAQRFDTGSKTLHGPIVPLASGVPTPGGRAQYAVSGNTFVYLSRDAQSIDAGSLVWADSVGNLSEVFPSRIPGWMQDLSRDGSRIVSGGWGLWVAETEGGLPRQIEGAGRTAFHPRWSHDATTVLYAAHDGLRMIGTSVGDSAILILASRSSNTLRGGVNTFRPVGWGPEGEVLFIENFPDGSSELRVREAAVDEIRTIQVGATHASLSPNGMWLAYESERGSGQAEVFVRSYQEAEAVRVSGSGGFSPTWGPRGDRVLFVTPRGEVMVSLLSFERGIRASIPTALPIDVDVDVEIEGGKVTIAAHPDGRLLIDRTAGDWGSLTVLRNWQALRGGGEGNE